MVKALCILLFIFISTESVFAQSGNPSGAGARGTIRRNVYGFRFGGRGGNIYHPYSNRLQPGYANLTRTFSRTYRRRLSFRKVTNEMYGTRAVRFSNQPYQVGFNRGGLPTIKRSTTARSYNHYNVPSESISLPPQPRSLTNRNDEAFERF